MMVVYMITSSSQPVFQILQQSKDFPSITGSTQSLIMARHMVISTSIVCVKLCLEFEHLQNAIHLNK